MKVFFLQRWCGLQQQTTVKKPEGETVATRVLRVRSLQRTCLTLAHVPDVTIKTNAQTATMSMFRKKQQDSSTASYGGVDDPSLNRKSGITAGRVINSSIAIDFGCILVAGLIVIGLLAHLHEQVQ